MSEHKEQFVEYRKVGDKEVPAESQSTWREELSKVGKCQQRQDGRWEQLIDLIQVANKFGFYDAHYPHSLKEATQIHFTMRNNDILSSMKSVLEVFKDAEDEFGLSAGGFVFALEYATGKRGERMRSSANEIIIRLQELIKAKSDINCEIEWSFIRELQRQL